MLETIFQLLYSLTAQSPFHQTPVPDESEKWINLPQWTQYKMSLDKQMDVTLLHSDFNFSPFRELTHIRGTEDNSAF